MLRMKCYINQGRYAKIYNTVFEDGTVLAVKENMYTSDIKRSYRFEQECIILKSLNHPNIIKYMGHCRTELHLELMDGDLSVEYLHPYFDSNKCMLDIAMGLNYIHTLPIAIIHRDIKIDNMLVKKTRGLVSHTVIGDFGFAVVSNYYMDYNKTGTPIYMAYEIIQPSSSELIHYTTAADMWAFGILCWHLLVKRSIYPDITTLSQYRDFIVQGHRANFIGISGDVKLFDMIKQCWKQDPAIRPKASDFINYLTTHK